MACRPCSPQERAVVEVAEALQQVLPLDGACYRASFFLEHYLTKEHQLDGRAVVGFVNDGTDDIFTASHGWYIFRGKVTAWTWPCVRADVSRSTAAWSACCSGGRKSGLVGHGPITSLCRLKA